MSLDPHFASSAYGLIAIAEVGLLALSVSVLRRRARTAAGRRHAATISAGCCSALLVLWAYLDFMQLLIVWQSDLPNEAPWYIVRSTGAWGIVGRHGGGGAISCCRSSLCCRRDCAGSPRGNRLRRRTADAERDRPRLVAGAAGIRARLRLWSMSWRCSALIGIARGAGAAGAAAARDARAGRASAMSEKVLSPARHEPTDVGARFIWIGVALVARRRCSFWGCWFCGCTRVPRPTGPCTCRCRTIPDPQLQPNPREDMARFHSEEMRWLERHRLDR